MGGSDSGLSCNHKPILADENLIVTGRNAQVARPRKLINEGKL